MKTYTLNINNKTVKVETDSNTPMLWVISELIKN